MGSRKNRIGRLHKNWEKKKSKRAERKRPAGRPRKHGKDIPCSLDELSSSAVTLPSPTWSYQAPSSTDFIRYVKLQEQCSSTEPVRVTHTLTVLPDFSWKVMVHDHEVCKPQCPPLSTFPEHLNIKSLKQLLTVLDNATVCPGHPDQHFVDFAHARKGQFVSPSGQTVAYLDKNANVHLNGQAYSQTIRTSTCALLVHGTKCPACVAFRDSLRAMYHRWYKRKCESPSKHTCSNSHTNYRFLNTPEKNSRLSQLKARADLAEQRIKRMEEKIASLTRVSEVEVDAPLHNDLAEILEDGTGEIQQQFEEGSFQRLFWEQQLDKIKTQSPKQYRWHPMLIRWCLHIKLISSAAYHALRQSGCIKLPSERTLRDYTRWIESRAGIQPEVTEQLLHEAKVESLKDWQKFIVIAFDEVKVKEGLVYDKHTCQIVGFTDLGEVNNQLLAYERSFQSDEAQQSVAKYMLVFMVRGLFIPLHFPYAQFPTTGATADVLFPMVWKVVRSLECASLKVIGVVCDKASPNCKLFKMHQTSTSPTHDPVHKVRNPYCTEVRFVYFFSDVPHLIKTVRNCWSNSFGHKNSRPLWIKGQHISWEHLRRVYNQGRTHSGLVLIPKLKRQHLDLNSYSRMRVDLAAQVLSSSVANALAYYSHPDTVETQTFVKMFDRFFDCLNIRHLKEGIQRRKPDLSPYRTPNDTRLKWLEEDFLGYLNEWEASVQERPGFTAAQKQMMLLSAATREGLRITVRSFVEATRFLLCHSGVRFILSERFCQDPLEAFFGNQRARGGRNDNPTVHQFLQNTVSLRVQGSVALNPARGNCRKRPIAQCSVDETPLPKRKRR